jgi:hypothetical protein
MISFSTLDVHEFFTHYQTKNFAGWSAGIEVIGSFFRPEVGQNHVKTGFFTKCVKPAPN